MDILRNSINWVILLFALQRWRSNKDSLWIQSPNSYIPSQFDPISVYSNFTYYYIGPLSAAIDSPKLGSCARIDFSWGCGRGYGHIQFTSLLYHSLVYLTIKCVYLVGWDSVFFILILVLLNMMSTSPVNRSCMNGYSWRVEPAFCCCCLVAKSYLSLIWSFSSGHTRGWHSPTPMKLGRVMWLILHHGL